MDSSCDNDFDCPFNFQCDANSRCIVSACQLSDDQDLFANEGTDCFFDEDCTFYAPHDSSSWGCVQNNCSDNFFPCRQCKRCPSEPRTLFNASESLWIERNETVVLNETGITLKIPPLSVLLNSSFYILGPDDFPSRRTLDDVTFSNATAPGNETMEREDLTSMTFTTLTPILIPANDSVTTPVVISTTETSIISEDTTSVSSVTAATGAAGGVEDAAATSSGT